MCIICEMKKAQAEGDTELLILGIDILFDAMVQVMDTVQRVNDANPEFYTIEERKTLNAVHTLFEPPEGVEPLSEIRANFKKASPPGTSLDEMISRTIAEDHPGSLANLAARKLH